MALILLWVTIGSWFKNYEGIIKVRFTPHIHFISRAEREEVVGQKDKCERGNMLRRYYIWKLDKWQNDYEVWDMILRGTTRKPEHIILRHPRSRTFMTVLMYLTFETEYADC